MAVAAFATGQSAWPGVGLLSERFAFHTTKLNVTSERLVGRSSDLFLACACANGDPQALRYFESEILSQIDLYVARFSLPKHLVDEVRQRVRIKLLVGDSPGIAGYRGHGSLGAWVRITAVRTAIDVVGAVASRGWTDTDLLDLGISVGDDPELAASKNLYRENFKAALDQGLRALNARDKTLLRLLVVDGLNIDAIGSIYRVHRATVARWFVAIRSRILLSLRGGLGLRTLPSPSEMRSLIGLLRDDIHLSAKRILTEAQDGAEGHGQ